jgi:hypothetical protein
MEQQPLTPLVPSVAEALVAFLNGRPVASRDRATKVVQGLRDQACSEE